MEMIVGAVATIIGSVVATYLAEKYRHSWTSNSHNQPSSALNDSLALVDNDKRNSSKPLKRPDRTDLMKLIGVTTFGSAPIFGIIATLAMFQVGYAVGAAGVEGMARTLSGQPLPPPQSMAPPNYFGEFFSTLMIAAFCVIAVYVCGWVLSGTRMARHLSLKVSTKTVIFIAAIGVIVAPIIGTVEMLLLASLTGDWFYLVAIAIALVQMFFVRFAL